MGGLHISIKPLSLQSNSSQHHVHVDYARTTKENCGMSSMPASSTAPRSPSVRSERRNWRLSGLSVTSPVDPSPPDDNGQPNAITDEIRKIKRYEDFTTIDWVQDAIQEQARRRAKRRDGSGFWDQEGTFGWRRKVSESYDAGQAWLVITIVGAAIGLISAVLNIITEWLSDVKLGHCTTAFYLNEQFCCWGAEGGMRYRVVLLMMELTYLFPRLPRMEAMDFLLAYQLLCILLLRGILNLTCPSDQSLRKHRLCSHLSPPLWLKYSLLTPQGPVYQR